MLGDAAKLGAEFCQVINSPQELVHCLAFVWSGHGYYSFNCDTLLTFSLT